jgi:hypothetical protein
MPMPGHFSCPLLEEILLSCAQAMTLCTWRVCLRTAQKLRCARLHNGLHLEHGANDHNRCSPRKRACLLLPVCCLDHMFGSVSGKSAEWQRSTCGEQHVLEQCCPAATCHAQKHDAACKYLPKFFQLIPQLQFFGGSSNSLAWDVYRGSYQFHRCRFDNVEIREMICKGIA